MSSQGGTGVLVPGLGNISRVEFEKHIRFYRSGGPDDEGIRVSGAWTARFRQGRLWGWDLGLKIDNQSDQHLEIDWDRTAFVGPDRKSLRVIPGDTRVILSNVSVPPAIVPPGSRGEWELFRVDTLDVKRHTPTTPLLLEWPENEVRIDIDCKIGGSPRRLTTEWGFQCDVEEVLERREEKEQQRRRFNRRLAVAGGLFAGLPVAFLVAFFVLVASTSLSASGRRSSASLAGLASARVEASRFEPTRPTSLNNLFSQVRRFHAWAQMIQEAKRNGAPEEELREAEVAFRSAQAKGFPVLRDALGPLGRADGERICRTTGDGYRTLTIEGGRTITHALGNVWGASNEERSAWPDSYRHWVNCLRFTNVIVQPKQGGTFTIDLDPPSDEELLTDCADSVAKSNIREYLVQEGALNSNGKWR